MLQKLYGCTSHRRVEGKCSQVADLATCTSTAPERRGWHMKKPCENRLSHPTGVRLGGHFNLHEHNSKAQKLAESEARQDTHGMKRGRRNRYDLGCEVVEGVRLCWRQACCSYFAIVFINCVKVGDACRSPVMAAGKRERMLRCVNTLHLLCFVRDHAKCRCVCPCLCAGVAVVGMGCGAGAFLSVARWVGCVWIRVLIGVPNVKVCSSISCGLLALGVRRLGRRAGVTLYCAA